MTKAELIGRIKMHEAHCRLDDSGSFCVAKVVELADGVLAVRDTDGEYTIYFDKSKCDVLGGGAFEDIGKNILNFPNDTGFMEDVRSRNWHDIRRTAQLALKKVRRGKIAWHKKPVIVQY